MNLLRPTNLGGGTSFYAMLNANKLEIHQLIIIIIIIGGAVLIP
jgi:hypothetical protein